MVRLREREIEINKITVSSEHYHSKIAKIAMERGKITAFLEDKREISLPIDLIIKE